MISEPAGEEQLDFARKIALRFLEARPRSEHELRVKLASRNVPEDVARELITRFREVGLVDDEAFAEAVVQTRVRVDRHGASRIRSELRRRGVTDEVAAAALTELDSDDELAAAHAFASRRSRSLRGVPPQVAQRRLYGALGRRGFSTSVIARVVADTLGELAGDLDDGGS
ncbi:MAG: regulatory protein RecX [Propionibacteriaceae bacterium]|nr:regulatory protein RecX [Propionibacteriaceae bacterium]